MLAAPQEIAGMVAGEPTPPVQENRSAALIQAVAGLAGLLEWRGLQEYQVRAQENAP